MIHIEKYHALAEDTRALLHAFIHAEFGHIPIVQQTTWAQPDWTILYTEGGTVVTFYNVVERYVEIDGISCKVAGINNVITPPASRGKGYATRVLNETTGFLFEELRANHSLLLCADHMIPFYNRLGWYQVSSTVYFDQPAGRQRWMANTMLLSAGGPVAPATIDLKGLPW